MKKQNKKLFPKRAGIIILIVVLLLVVLYGIKHRSKIDPEMYQPASSVGTNSGSLSQEAYSVENRDWVLKSYRGLDGELKKVIVPRATVPSAVFKDKTISGSTGCNSYSGTYEITGDKIKISPLVRTKINCDGVMEQEDDFINVLESTYTFKVDTKVLEGKNARGGYDETGTLHFFSDEGTLIASFTRLIPG